MTADAWREVRNLLEGALALPRTERAAYLDVHCSSPEVRAEVEALLANTSDPLMASDPADDPGDDRERPVPLGPGTYLSHYRIIRTLGAGGMGTVYLAFDERLNRDVAVKVLKKQTDARARTRVLREARAAAALDHPSICAVHEVGVDASEGDFIVMQYVEGETLDDRLGRGPLRPREAISIGRQLAEALSVAHAHGIVHRDLKPQNVIIDRTGRPRLLDFGIAHALDARHVTTVATTQMTDARAIVGTPPYMSPEQMQGGVVDARSDLFSLGCVVYECLTGTRAFDGQTLADVCGRVMHVNPEPPSVRRPGLAADYDGLCMRLLEKEPAARFQSAGEAVGAMRLLETAPATVSPPSTTRTARLRRRLAVMGAGVLAMGAVVLALSLMGVPGGLLPPAWRTTSLPTAPDAARHWYEVGVDALRTGSYAGALASFQEAIRLFPDYAHAYSRAAEAYSELDNRRAATKALVRVSDLVPEESALAEDERLRLRAVRASVLQEHPDAEQAYQTLATRHPDDSGALVDLARAQDAGGRWVAALDTLARAIAINPQDASAHLRLGLLEARRGQKDRALMAIDEATRLYRAAANIECEAETLLRRGMVLNAVGDLAEAQTALDRVIVLTADPRYAVQQLRARFELAAVLSSRGRFADAEEMARAAMDEATQLQFETVAAHGLIDLADALLVAGRIADADAHLERAFALAKAHDATHTAMRARLQQAALRQADGRAKEAVDMAEAARTFFAANGYVRWDAVARSILSRAHEDLGDYASAGAMADEVLTFAQSVGDDALAATALENLAGVRAAEGRLPDALEARERIEAIHRRQGDHFSLPFDLVNCAELLVRLGRGADAEGRLAEVEAGIASGRESYVLRSRRVAMVRALRAATEGRDVEVLPHAAVAIGKGDVTRDSTALLGAALAAYARASLARRPTPADALLARQEIDTPARREARYWLTRGRAARAQGDEVIALLDAALETAPVQQNAELRWRLAATALMAGRSDPSQAARWREVAARGLADVRRAWATTHVDGYVRRADLAPLHALAQ